MMLPFTFYSQFLGFVCEILSDRLVAEILLKSINQLIKQSVGQSETITVPKINENEQIYTSKNITFLAHCRGIWMTAEGKRAEWGHPWSE